MIKVDKNPVFIFRFVMVDKMYKIKNGAKIIKKFNKNGAFLKRINFIDQSDMVNYLNVQMSFF